MIPWRALGGSFLLLALVGACGGSGPRTRMAPTPPARAGARPPPGVAHPRAARREEGLLALLDKYTLRSPAADRWQVLIESFSEASLQKIHALDPSLPLIQLYSSAETSATIQGKLDQARAYAVGVGPDKGG